MTTFPYKLTFYGLFETLLATFSIFVLYILVKTSCPNPTAKTPFLHPSYVYHLLPQSLAAS